MPTQIKNRRGEKEWYAVWKEGGRRKFKRCPTEDAALLYEIEKRREVETHSLTPKVVVLAGLLVNYLASTEARGIGRSSVQEKAFIFKEFGAAIGPRRDVRTITYGEVERYLGTVAQKVSGDRANRHRIHILAAYNWGIKAMGLPAPNPWKVDKFKFERKKRYAPALEDFWKVVDAIEDQQIQRLLMAFLHTSARLSELLQLKWADVDMKRRLVKLSTGKRMAGREADPIRFTQGLEDVLKEQRRHIELRSEYVFADKEGRPLRREIGKQMALWCARAQVRPFTLHCVRHLSASLMAESGMPIQAVQARLRHRNAAITSDYLHSLTGGQDVLEGLFDRPSEKAPTPERGGLSASQGASHFSESAP